MTTPEALGRKLQGLATSTKGVSEKSIRRGAAIVRDDALAAIGAATHGTFRLRGVRSRLGVEAKLGVTSKVIGHGSQTEAIIRAQGPWQFIEHDIAPHAVGVRAEARGEEAVMLVPGGTGFATGPWIAGGSHGKHTWRLASARSKPKVKKLYDQEVMRHIRTNF